MFFKIFVTFNVLVHMSVLSVCARLLFLPENRIPYNSLMTNIPSRRSAIGMFEPYFSEKLNCQFRVNNTKQCINETYKYTNECGYEDCFRGVGESCDDELYIGFPVHGKCHQSLHCVCGKCTGCLDKECRAELCRRNGYYAYNENEHNFIGNDFN